MNHGIMSAMNPISSLRPTVLALLLCVSVSPVRARPAVTATQPASEAAIIAPAVIECPAWARETVPAWLEPYRGKRGLPDPYPQQKEPIGEKTAGIDLWQANHFIVYRPETAEYLYHEYTSLQVPYRRGLVPMCEKIVAKCTAGLTGDREKALALLSRAMPELLTHPGIPPYGPVPPWNRGCSEERLLDSGLGWCNEQARVFVRLCQVAGIPARMIFLFYADRKSGHVVSEFYADGRWSMADSSWGCVFPAANGHLMSAAECHEDRHAQRVGQAYLRRIEEILRYSDEFLVGRRFKHVDDPQERARLTAEMAQRKRESLRAATADEMGEPLWVFGVQNLPMPEE